MGRQQRRICGVLRRLATRLDADDPKCGGEAHALAGRGGALLDPEKLHEHAPGHARHPASRILLEDVYHACLLHEDFRASNLTLVHLRTSEWGATKRAPLRRADVGAGAPFPRSQEVGQHDPGDRFKCANPI